VEVHGVGVEAVPLVVSLALEAHLHVEVEQDGQVGDQAASGVADQGADLLQILLVTVALIGDGRVCVAVGQHDLARCQPWTDDLLHDLGARRLVEQRLGARMHLHVLQVVDHFPDLLADGRAARLARGKNGVSLLAQELDEMGNVRGLAGAFGAFEGDEHGDRLEIQDFLIIRSHFAHNRNHLFNFPVIFPS